MEYFIVKGFLAIVFVLAIYGLFNLYKLKHNDKPENKHDWEDY